MSADFKLMILANFETQQEALRGQFYLQESTRPDSADGLEGEELSLFLATEDQPYSDECQVTEDDELVWVVEDFDRYSDDYTNAITLGAEDQLMVLFFYEDEPCFSIYGLEKDDEGNIVEYGYFETTFHDDLERDDPIQAFNQQLLNKLEEKGEVDFIQWLDNSLREDFNIPEWNFDD